MTHEGVNEKSSAEEAKRSYDEFKREHDDFWAKHSCQGAAVQHDAGGAAGHVPLALFRIVPARGSDYHRC